MKYIIIESKSMNGVNKNNGTLNKKVSIFLQKDLSPFFKDRWNVPFTILDVIWLLNPMNSNGRVHCPLRYRNSCAKANFIAAMF